MNRGDRREDTVRGDADRELFVLPLGETCVKCGWEAHATRARGMRIWRSIRPSATLSLDENSSRLSLGRKAFGRKKSHKAQKIAEYSNPLFFAPFAPFCGHSSFGIRGGDLGSNRGNVRAKSDVTGTGGKHGGADEAPGVGGIAAAAMGCGSVSERAQGTPGKSEAGAEVEA
jgi:hypothetical protein